MSEIDLELLKEAGLTAYESKCYVALTKYGTMEGSQVAEKTEVPKTRVYDVLKSLENKGLASRIQERPMKFSPVQPEKGLKPLYERRKNRLEHVEQEALEALNNLDEIGERKDVEQKVDVVYGQENMFSQMTQRFENARDEVFGVIVGRVPPKSTRIKIRKMIERGLDFRLIISQYDQENRKAYEKFNENAKIRYYDKDLKYIILVKDRETAAINVLNPEEDDERITVFFEVPQLAEAMAEYLENLWQDSIPLEEVRPQ